MGLERGAPRWAEEHGRPRQWVGERNAAGRPLLTGAGYELVRHYWRMHRDLAAPVSAPPPPTGISLRALEPQVDAERLHALNDAAFAETPDYRPESLGEFREEYLQGHDLAPALSLVAERAGRPVGFLIARRWENGDGYVDLPGVHPGERGRGSARRCCARRSPASEPRGSRRRSSEWRPTTRARCVSTSARA